MCIRDRRNEKGQLKEAEYIIHERPIEVPEHDMEHTSEPPAFDSSVSDEPMSENPVLDEPVSEGTTQLNTNISNTKELNTDVSKYPSINNADSRKDSANWILKDGWIDITRTRSS